MRDWLVGLELPPAPPISRQRRLLGAIRDAALQLWRPGRRAGLHQVRRASSPRLGALIQIGIAGLRFRPRWAGRVLLTEPLCWWSAFISGIQQGEGSCGSTYRTGLVPEPGMGRGSPADQQSCLPTIAQAKACRDCGGIEVVKEQGGFRCRAGCGLPWAKYALVQIGSQCTGALFFIDLSP